MTSRDNTKMAKVTGIGMKRPKLTRDWTQARAKCDAQGCRIEGCTRPPEAAHIIGRECDTTQPEVGWSPHVEWGGKSGRRFVVAPERICPLCDGHHRAYDRGDLDILGLLTIEEQAQALLDAGGTFPMLWRTMASENPRRAA